ncbi:MAG: hypothetical protein CMC08_09380 [Flavobacteriaceae bacterium]|nr:hypothetical protein [Flavobacteriaceae bacterium]
MGKNPIISVIVPTKNRSILLIKMLNSLLDQNYQDWECIIIDDGSNPEDKIVIEKFLKAKKNIFYYERPSAQVSGPSSCRNFGLQKVKGKYVQFFDDDDIMYPEMLTEKFRGIERAKADVVVAPMDFYDVSAQKILKQNVIVSKNIIVDYVIGNVSWYVSGPMWRKEFLKVKFDDKITVLDDWDFNLRNLYLNPRMVFCEKPLQQYNRYQSQTLSEHRDANQQLSVFRTYKKHFLLLKKSRILNPKMRECLVERLVLLMRDSLVLKSNLAKHIFSFLISQFETINKRKIFLIAIGYLTYRLTGRGYSLLKYPSK